MAACYYLHATLDLNLEVTLHVFIFSGDKEVVEEVVEKEVVAEGSTTTGDNIANPSHTATLDATGSSG